jgi:long-chain fatty acid transport protein
MDIIMKKLLHLSVAGVLFSTGLSLSGHVYSSGFALIENSASGMGQAFAGAAAVAEDPSTLFFNPAGMTYLDGTQLTAGLHIVSSNAEFNDKGSTDPFGGAIIGNDEGGNAGGTHYIPNLYYVREFGEGKYRFGLGINAPFGLGTEYNDDWMGRYTSTKSEVKTVNINPAIAFKGSERLSIGLGINLQYIKATLESKINQSAFRSADARAKVTGDAWNVGYNGGVIYEYAAQSKLGLHFRSAINQDLEGKVKYTNVHPALEMIAGLVDKNVTAGIDTPSTLSASIAHQFNPKLTLLADITFTRWGNFETLHVVGDDGSNVSFVKENWNDVLRYSLGMKYQHNEKWIFRTGIALDETPIDNKYRTSRIPGDNRFWLSFGASYTPSKNLTLDVGYAHLWVENARIEEEFRLAGIGTGTLKGKYEATVDILSAQATWRF